ncbi:MerR family transcriptional regulator [Amycolatopsis sp. H20-H5]|uniref:MerR family transcriptional regulator n=1 Tax=Amycolatopsis sp. H20-H5 TaxID=3046309 RepID=UPI002DB7A362|nr:MerR family transcriptional regulator [Amycolatopsis sp. H20-H5]MEC3976400.1 MerR family transcriptional regulator [Amycolatopsis sp. H20-H5]
MDVDAATTAVPGLWTPGKVAELLGVSPVTLRSWDARYGIGPSVRSDGRHRRYSDVDVKRLQHMQRLIERGAKAREAAAVALAGRVVEGVSASESVIELADAAQELRFASMAGLLDESFAMNGPVATWSEVLVPVLRNLGERWIRGDLCFEADWALTDEISCALERYLGPLRETMAGRSVLLACCPEERHSLPMEVLRAALVDQGVPAVFLRQMVPPETTIGMALKLDPAVVVLWSMSANSADDLLVQRLQRRGFEVCVAGPGWARFSELAVPWVDDLTSALQLIRERALTPVFPGAAVDHSTE